jgi:hypothetical protein
MDEVPAGREPIGAATSGEGETFLRFLMRIGTLLVGPVFVVAGMGLALKVCEHRHIALEEHTGAYYKWVFECVSIAILASCSVISAIHTRLSDTASAQEARIWSWKLRIAFGLIGGLIAAFSCQDQWRAGQLGLSAVSGVLAILLGCDAIVVKRRGKPARIPAHPRGSAGA